MRQSGPFLQNGKQFHFLLYLFQNRKQPGTIGGYRSAIADKLGSFPINIRTDDNLTRLLDSFHRDRPKGRRCIPSWNLSVVLHQLTKAPFEPLKEASLKHLTFTVILLHEKSGRTFCPKTSKKFRTFSENLGQNSCQSNFHSTGC